MKTILITGGAGYIGSHTALALHRAGFQTILLDNFSNSSPKQLERLEDYLKTENLIYQKPLFFQVDCADPKALSFCFEKIEQQHPSIQILGCIHFAAYKAVGISVQKPLDYYQNNLQSLWNLLGQMEKYGIENLVYSSSATVYGSHAKSPLHEKDPLSPCSNPYGFTKQMGEQIIEDFVKVSGNKQKAILLRYFNPIGAEGKMGEEPQGVPNNLIPYLTQAAMGKQKLLTVHGADYPTPDGTCIRDYVDVRDLAIAHQLALAYLSEKMGEKKLEIINVGVGKGHSVLECIQNFEKATGVKVPYQIGSRRAGDLAEIYADVSKAEKLLGFKTKYSLVESLKKAWEWEIFQKENV